MPLAILQNMITKPAPQGVGLFIADPGGFLVADSQTDFLERNQTSSSFAHVNSAHEYFPSVNAPMSDIITQDFGSNKESTINATSNSTAVGYSHGEYSSPLDGQVHYMVSQPLASFGWRIGADIPYSQILQAGSTDPTTDSFNNLKITVYTIVAIVTGIGIVLVYLFSSRITAVN